MNAPIRQPSYDVEAIRKEFPILSKQVYGKPLVYLDNAASAQKPRAVIDAMVGCMEGAYANVHRGLHYMANAATEGFEGARETTRQFLNATSTDEIVFTRNATEAYNLVASSMHRGGLIGEGDEIILSIMEHHSNIVPWHFLRERYGAVIKWAPVDDEGNFLLDAYEKLFSPRTKMVAITHMSNVLGTVTPAEAIIRIAHGHGVPVLLDGAQSAVHRTIDVQALDCDFFVFTGHKVYGPTGIGVLYGKKEWLDRLPPYQGGGEMIRTVSEDTITYNDPPHRFEAGTPAIIEAVGLGAALEFMMGVGREAISAHEDALTAYAQERLGAMNAIRLIGTARDKGGVVAFEMKGTHAHDIATVIDRQGIAIRAGTHCAMPLLNRFGATSTCRASFGLYNTKAEIDALAEALAKAEMLFA
ncbi:cysteine desulfurase [Methylobacterium haplocladii]|uniref:Cysteine desulfurase n=1 Tax=Methylobacterium haplocladii TaxID=1176176 RepID=A0A512ITK9_9HYPH|nr:cysteine desulfurase [Methylobacterium haplocladii]GEP01045.1 cysteine desulfurase [Methylobacterium haplocladii]GJD83199.1 Cysteine desulfurase SufS [Methylobacterium haplocladii]GLS60583.1 cysteine desulfurase [Methylobacterium haplocladii]